MSKTHVGILHEILAALENLGGQAVSNNIIDEIERIRSVPLTEQQRSNLRTYLNIYSSKVKVSDGKKYFHRVGPGIWALNNNGKSAVVQVQQKTKVISEIHTPITESFETIVNTLKTIKEYRDYYDPNSSSWLTYINEIFHILGFSTQQKDSHIFLLNGMGEHNTPKAIVAYNLPGDNFEEILPGLTWESYLLFAANYHQLEWGILTNGLKIKVVNFRSYKKAKPFFETDFDEIIRNERSDSFFTVYKVFSKIKNGSALPSVEVKPVNINHKSSDMPKTLSNILNVYKEMSQNNGDFRQACIFVSQKEKVSVGTISDACTRRLDINVAGFLDLYASKHKLIKHLNSYHPEHTEEIKFFLAEID